MSDPQPDQQATNIYIETLQVDLAFSDGTTTTVTAPTPDVAKPPPVQSTRPLCLYNDERIVVTKADIAKGGNSLAYWNESLNPNISANRGIKSFGHAGKSNDQVHFYGPNYIPSGVTAVTQDTSSGEGDSRNFLDDCKAVHGLGQRFKLDTNTATANACGATAVKTIRSLVTKLKTVTVGGNSGQKLWSAWAWSNLGPGVSLVYEHPDFDAQLKTDFSNWAFSVFMLNTTSPPKQNLGVVLNHTSGSNWEMAMMASRIYIGYLDTNKTRGQQIIDSARAQLYQMVRSQIYWTGDYHADLKAPWPVASNPGFGLYRTQDQMAQTFGFANAAASTGKWFNGQMAEITRDISHQNMTTCAVFAALLTLHINGVSDAFSSAAFPGGVDRLMAGFESTLGGWWREVLDVGWQAPWNGKIEYIPAAIDTSYLGDSDWCPAGIHNTRDWAALGLGKWQDGALQPAPSFRISGSMVDHGWPIARHVLKTVLGRPTPNLDSIMTRSVGVGSRTPTSVAGVDVIRTSDQTLYPALLFAA